MSSESVEVPADEVVVDRSELDALTQRVDQLESEKQRQAEETERLEERVEQLETDKVTAAKDRAAIRSDLNGHVEDLKSKIGAEKDELGRRIAKLARRLTGCESELGVGASEATATAEGGEDAVGLTKLQRFIRHGPESVIDGRVTATHRRAHELATNFGDWGKTVSDTYGKRVMLRSKEDQVKSHLEAVGDERLQWTQVYRAMQKLEEIGYETNLRIREGTEDEGKYVLENKISDGGANSWMVND